MPDFTYHSLVGSASIAGSILANADLPWRRQGLRIQVPLSQIPCESYIDEIYKWVYFSKMII
jgi:hypothetical protein